MAPRVVVVILNWNGKDDTITCVRSVCKITYTNYEIVLVDNASTDGSVPCFKRLFPHISVVENSANFGFAEGNNVGVQWALSRGADYVLLLNNDTVVERGFLEELVTAAQNDRSIGFAGPKIYYCKHAGRNDVISFAGGKFHLWTGRITRLCLDVIDRGQCDCLREVDYVEGSCLLARMDAIEDVGPLNPAYFLYWEDVELCLRGAKAGYKTVYVPKARIWHKVGVKVREKRGTAYYYLGRNLVLLVKQHASLGQQLVFLSTLLLFQMVSLTLVSVLLHRSMLEPSSFIRGVRDALQGRAVERP